MVFLVRVIALASLFVTGSRVATAQLIYAAAGVVTNATPAAAGATAVPQDDFEDEYAPMSPAVSDPFEPLNRTMFKFNDSVFTHVLKPVSRGYETVVPGVARRGLSSFFDNIRFPVRFIGSALQGKFDRAAAETSKFVVNTTVGLAGFIKVSDRFTGLRVPAEDLGQAFGKWGIGHGPFLVLPVLGPSSVRDLVGRVGDSYATPTSWDFVDEYDSSVRIGLQVTDVVSSLPGLVSTYDALRQSAVDPYIAFRSAYLQYRAGEVAK